MSKRLCRDNKLDLDLKFVIFYYLIRVEGKLYFVEFKNYDNMFKNNLCFFDYGEIMNYNKILSKVS